MIKPIQFKSNISFTQANNIKRKDVINTIRENDIKQYELKQARIDASYEFINGQLVMVKSETTDAYLSKRKEYQEWLNGEI